LIARIALEFAYAGLTADKIVCPHKVGLVMSSLFSQIAQPALRSPAALPKRRTEMLSSSMIARTVRTLHRLIERYRSRKPRSRWSDGAVRDGHVSLLRLAKRRAERVIVSIFVNPTQFSPTEDYGAYARTWKADFATFAAEVVDIVWSAGSARLIDNMAVQA
jgi:pantoate-beta-alanine ligase